MRLYRKFKEFERQHVLVGDTSNRSRWGIPSRPWRFPGLKFSRWRAIVLPMKDKLSEARFFPTHQMLWIINRGWGQGKCKALVESLSSLLWDYRGPTIRQNQGVHGRLPVTEILVNIAFKDSLCDFDASTPEMFPFQEKIHMRQRVLDGCHKSISVEKSCLGKLHL